MKISVYITSYNQKEYLSEAIESVLAQTLPPYQIIIVDDCSTDGSKELITGYISRFPELITPIYHSCNKGVTQSRIDALNLVTGDYATYLDGDDRFLPSKLEKESKLLQENPNVHIVFSNFYFMNAEGKHVRLWADGETPPEGYVFQKVFAREFPKRTLFRNELVDYQAWERIGFHDPHINLYEDYEMRIRLTKQLQVAYCNEPLAEYRQHDKGLSKAKKSEHLAAFKYIFRKNKSLLKDLSIEEQQYVKRKLNGWISNI